MMLQSHHPYHAEGWHLDKKGAIAVVGYGETWRDMARHGETMEFIQVVSLALGPSLPVDRADGGAMVADGC